MKVNTEMEIVFTRYSDSFAHRIETKCTTVKEHGSSEKVVLDGKELTLFERILGIGNLKTK